LTIKVTTNCTSILCREEKWKEIIVQNYQYLNEWIVKNNYSLPLISNIIKNIRTRKLFTKLDLKWDYNNVRIKKNDE